MRIHRDADTEIGVRWYFADDDAPWLDTYTRFASGNWASQKTGWEGVGEVQGAPRPWSNGKRPKGLIGDHVCGKLSDFVDGGSVLDPTICTDDEGVSGCCVNKLTCCDFQRIHSLVLSIVHVEQVNPSLPLIGHVGKTFALESVHPEGGFNFAMPFPVYLPGAITPFSCFVECLNDTFPLFATNTLGPAITSENTSLDPLGIRFIPLALFFFYPDFSFTLEVWTLAIGVDPGPLVPPPPGPTPGFPPGTFPPGTFPRGTFPPS